MVYLDHIEKMWELFEFQKLNILKFFYLAEMYSFLFSVCNGPNS